jgi:hypothetical protein
MPAGYHCCAPEDEKEIMGIARNLQIEELRHGQLFHGIKVDCLGFAILLYDTLEWHEKIIPRFSWDSTKLKEVLPLSWDDLKIGDIALFLRKKRINFARIFTHMGIKVDDHSLAHMAGSIKIEPMSQVLETRIHLTKQNIDSVYTPTDV